VTVDLWVMGMSVFLRGDLEEKIGFCFRVYDINMNEQISRDEM
jgi:Ca2+-binding EF-hand superfamily protein